MLSRHVFFSPKYIDTTKQRRDQLIAIDKSVHGCGEERRTQWPPQAMHKNSTDLISILSLEALLARLRIRDVHVSEVFLRRESQLPSSYFRMWQLVPLHLHVFTINSPALGGRNTLYSHITSLLKETVYMRLNFHCPFFCKFFSVTRAITSACAKLLQKALG